MPPAILTVDVVPSMHRATIRKRIADEVEPESRAWMESLASRSATGLTPNSKSSACRYRNRTFQ